MVWTLFWEEICISHMLHIRTYLFLVKKLQLLT